MGAGWGCSSPLKRLGGKKGKHRRDSSFCGEGSEGSNDNLNNEQACRQQPVSSTSLSQVKQSTELIGGKGQQHKFIIENENTIHSEINEDHPSTASYYTDGKNHNEEGTKISEHSTGLEAIKSSAGNVTTSTSGDPFNCSLSGASAVAKIIGLNGGSYVPHDRHLLVSPALSPAPSTCYSPSPALSTLGSTMLDLNDLNEAFKTLTFGLQSTYQQQQQQSGQHSRILTTTNNSQKIKQPEKQNLPELHNYYTQQLIQTQAELIKNISIIFITNDTFQTTSFDGSIENNNLPPTTINTDKLANVIESNLKTFCDEHLFNLRFLNLSHTHLIKYLHINNLLDASMKIFEQECQENSQQTIIILLSNLSSTSLSSFDSINTSNSQQNLDKRQLPTKIEAQIMFKLQAAISQESKTASNDNDLLKRWYNQLGNAYYLNPLYLVYPKILSESIEERDQAWQNWLSESNQLIKLVSQILETNNELNDEIKLKSFFSSYVDYIMNEPALQKRTLLIRNYFQPVNTNLVSNQQQQQQQANQSIQIGQIKDSNLNELARSLADPNKLTLKRSMNDEEFTKTINDWILDNANKYIESFLENQIINGKQTPPFIEKNLFIELTCQRHCFVDYLDNCTENFEAKCRNFYNSHILPILNGVINHNNQSTTSPIESISNDSNGHHSANHLVFMSGPKGCGKSSLFAQIIKLTIQDFLKKAQIIYRFCGITIDSTTSNRLLRSICEQFCQTQGENITAASYVYSSRKEVMNSLNKIIQQQTSFLFIDGLNIYNENNINDESDFGWLCELESNPRIKVFITLETDSELYKKALGTYTDATYISLDYPTITEWAQMLTSTARSKRFNSATSLYDEIKNLDVNNTNQSSLDSKETDKLTYRDFSNIIHMCRIRKLNNESIYPELTVKMIQNNPIENIKNVHQNILNHLHYLMTPYQVCALLIILDLSRNGLSEFDIINIMTFITQCKSSLISKDLSALKFSTSLLNYILFQLKPWLIYILSDKTVKITIQQNFLSKSLDYYTKSKYQNIKQEIQDILLEYFGRQSSTTIQTSAGKSGENFETNEIIKSTELLWLATQASELVHLLIKTNPSKAKEYILNKHQFFNQFLYNQMPEEFVEDYNILKKISLASKKNSTSNEELQLLVNYIKQSIYPLRYDGSQIYSQIYCRAIEMIKSSKSSKYKRFNDIINIASCPPKRSLLPISETSVNSFIKTRIGLNQPHQLSSSKNNITTSTMNTSSSSSLNTPSQGAMVTGGGQRSGQQQGGGGGGGASGNQNQVAKQKIYTIKDNHRHVIVIYPDKGSLSVWDIFEEKPVRTINNLDQPRDLRMIDQRRAVILCNRELRVYDLDSGLLVNKLKGVMNQKMPFFEVYGENYVVALARNRMYVNMLNLNTGELETTFKVGEDRFLNSLLVSANGGICVCGDETQKPFPLLVWNLNERRLLYDLRLDKHEFLTRMSAISDDGHFVVSVCKQIGDDHTSTIGSSNSSSSMMSHKSSPNFIVIYDLNSGTLFKKWKPGIDSCGVAISLAPNKTGKVINCIVNNTILIWDLATGSRRHTLIGHSAPVDVIKVQNNRLFSMDSSCRDQSLRIWDIEEGYCLAVFSPDAPVNSCQMSIRGDALICCFAAETRLSTLVMCKNETVNEVVKRNKRRKSSKSLYIFDEPPGSRKQSM